MYDWQDRYNAMHERFVPWIERARSLAGATVLEFGCGTGAVACALAGRCGRVLGVDIDADAVSTAVWKASQLGLRNVEFEGRDFDGCLARIEGMASRAEGGVDVLVLYAVLEHMTFDERMRLLRLAARPGVLTPGGVIVVCESPNRLLWHDYHTSQTPFNFQLPPEVAIACAKGVRRAEFERAMTEARAAGAGAEHEAFVRWGRGISYHEFELAGLLKRVVVSNYEPELLPVRHVHREELHLARFMHRHAGELPPGLAPCFGRYYIDCIIAGEAPKSPALHITPWAMETVSSRAVGYTAWDTVVMLGEDSEVVATFPGATRRCVLGVEPRRETAMTIRVAADRRGEVVRKIEPSATGQTRYVEVRLDGPATTVRVRGPAGMEISFVGYERPALRAEALGSSQY